MNDRLGDVEELSSEDWAVVGDSEEGQTWGTGAKPTKKKRKPSWRKLKRIIQNRKKQPANKLENGRGSTAAENSVADKDDSFGDIELGEEISSSPNYMSTFFKEVEHIKNDIDTIKGATKTIRDINEAALLATSTEREDELSSRLKSLVNDTNNKAKRTKDALSFLKDETNILKENRAIKQSALRVRENLVNTLTRKFVDEVKLYQKGQQMYRKDIKSKASRQIRTIKPNATDEEIDLVIRSDGGRDALYKERILKGGIADPIETACKKVASKYQDVLTLEQSLSELHEMLVDMALLTEQQGELLDHIEIHVQKAADEIEHGNEDLVKSIDYQKAIRKKQGWIIIIVVVVATVIILSILL